MSAPAELVAEGELRSLNPATLEVVGSVRTTDPAELGKVVAQAREAQARWAQTSLDERRRLVLDVTRVLLDRMDEVAELVTAETGKPLVESYTAELLVSVENARWVAAHAPRVLRVERAPLSGAWVERAFAQAGAPVGLVQTVQGSGDEVGDALVRAPGIAKDFFTGSTEGGRRIGVACAELLRPATLELGGKDPMLVLRDADLGRAVEGALWGAFSNCGQVCAGVERIYVARERYEEFAGALARRAGELRLGRGDDPATELGPLVSEGQRARVEDLVAQAREHGADAVCGGRRPDVGLPGWFYEPTVLAGGDGSARLEREEVFGPVVTVAPFADEDEAVALANSTPFGLGASVWTRDLERARRLAARLGAGS